MPEIISPRFDLTMRMSESAQERVLAVTKEGSAGNFSPISNLSSAKDLQAFQHAEISYLFKVIKKKNISNVSSPARSLSPTI